MPTFEYTRFFVCDPTDVNYPLAPTTALVDLNEAESSAACTGFGLVDAPEFAFDIETVELGQFGVDGEVQAAARATTGEVRFSLYWKNKAVPATIADVRKLAGALLSGGVLLWQPAGSDEVEYIDFVRSTEPQLWRGQPGGLYQVLKRLVEARGMPLAVRCNPRPRLAVVPGAVVRLSNAVGAREVIIDNPGNVPSEVKVTLTPVAGNVGAVRYGVRDHGNLAEHATRYSFAVADASLRLDTTAEVVADSSGAGGTAAVTTFANNEQLARRWRKVINFAAHPTAMDGVHRAYLRVLERGGTDQGRYRVQLRYGLDEGDVVMTHNDVVPLDWRDVGTRNYVEIDLGLVYVPPGASKLTVELFVERRSGDAEFVSDMLSLEPADERHAIISVPGFRLGKWGLDVFDADELGGTGALKRRTYRLNALDEVAFAKPAVGRELAAGVYAVEFRGALREPLDEQIEMARLEVIENPDANGDGTVRKFLRLRNRAEQLWTRRERALYFSVSAADVAASMKFGVRVRQTAATHSRRRIQIAQLRMSYMRAVTNAEPIVIDTFERRTYAGGSVPAFAMIHENELPYAPPGESSWVFAFGDLPTDPGYADMDEREPLARSILTRQVDVQIDVIPRVTH